MLIKAIFLFKFKFRIIFSLPYFYRSKIDFDILFISDIEYSLWNERLKTFKSRLSK